MASKGKKASRKWILLVSALVVVVAVGCGVWYYLGHNSSEPVYVFPFQYVGMTEYWGDSQESHGPVTTDKIQTVFLSDTQTVTEVLVKSGDTVKKGDLLMTFDTTLSDLQLERKRLDVEKLKLQLEDAKRHLWEINSMKPMVIPSFDDDETEDDEALGEQLAAGEYRVYPEQTGEKSEKYDGYAKERALICWIHSDRGIDDEVFGELWEKAVEYQTDNAPEPTEPEPGPGGSDDSTKESTESADSTEASTDAAESDVPEDAAGSARGITGFSDSDSEEDPAPGKPTVAVNAFHVVFRITQKNRLLGTKDVWQGLVVTKEGSAYRFRFEDAMVPDYVLDTGDGDTSINRPEIDFGSGYTAAQIAQMRSDQQKKIKDLEFQIKMADAEYKIMQTEVDDGNVYAQIDGKVVTLLSEEEAKQTKQPMLKVSGGGGFYVEGFISELEKGKMKLKQEVTVNDWNTGATYTGTIASIGDFPTRDGYFNGNGNPNASYYPFKVFVDESADLQAGSYVSVAYSTAESENGIYLENPFLRTEKGKSYVLVQGADGKLEQRFVTTGKSLWGNYTEILDGLTAEDLIAFPYGKHVKPGAVAVEGDMSNLYG